MFLHLRTAGSWVPMLPQAILMESSPACNPAALFLHLRIFYELCCMISIAPSVEEARFVLLFLTQLLQKVLQLLQGPLQAPNASWSHQTLPQELQHKLNVCSAAPPGPAPIPAEDSHSGLIVGREPDGDPDPDADAVPNQNCQADPNADTTLRVPQLMATAVCSVDASPTSPLPVQMYLQRAVDHLRAVSGADINTSPNSTSGAAAAWHPDPEFRALVQQYCQETLQTQLNQSKEVCSGHSVVVIAGQTNTHS